MPSVGGPGVQLAAARADASVSVKRCGTDLAAGVRCQASSAAFASETAGGFAEGRSALCGAAGIWASSKAVMNAERNMKFSSDRATRPAADGCRTPTGGVE